jgi:hypothetical protein
MSENNNKPKIQLPSRLKVKSEDPPEYKANAQTDDKRVRELAQQWADLHAKPKQRDKMDELLAGLPEPMQRKVILCGQRIAAGLSPKIAT